MFPWRRLSGNSLRTGDRAGVARAVLGSGASEAGLEGAADADSECRLKEKQGEADGAQGERDREGSVQ